MRRTFRNTTCRSGSGGTDMAWSVTCLRSWVWKYPDHLDRVCKTMPLEGEGLVGSPSVRASALCRTLGLQATVDSVAVPRCQSRLKRSDSLLREYGRACRWSAWGIGRLCFRQDNLRRALPHLAPALAKPHQLFPGFLYQICLDLQHETLCQSSASTYG